MPSVGQAATPARGMPPGGGPAMMPALTPPGPTGATVTRPDPGQPVWGYLDNGMAYLLLESHAAPLIGSSVIVRSGSTREDFATSGASHFLEHLLFNGTETRTQEQLYDEVDALGGYNNATTRQSHVLYMMVTPAEKFRAGLEIQRDMLFHSTLPPEKVEKERGIILEELAKDRDQGSFETERQLDLCAFGPGGPGLPVLGSEQSIRTISRDSIGAFYRRLYTPQNMTLVVVGDFVSGEMERELRETFGAEPPGAPPPPFSMEEEPFDDSHRVVYQDDASNVLEWVFRGPDPRGTDFLAFECLNDLLGGGDSSPLMSALRERFTGKILDAGARLQLFPGRSYLRIRVESDPSLDWRTLADAVPAMLAGAPLPSPAEIEAWKVSRETGEYFLREKPHYYGIIRGDEIAAQGIDAILGLPERLARISPAGVATVRPSWATGGSRLAVALAKGSGSADSTAARQAESLRTTLPNGLELLVLSSPESPVLALHLFVRGRSEAEPAGMDGAVELLHRLMAVRTARSTPAELERRLREIGAELKTADDPNIPYDDFYSTSAASFVRLQTLDRDAEKAFGLLAELLGPRAWTDQEFEEARQALLAAAERSATSGAAAGRQMVRKSLYGDSWRSRAVFGSPATLKAIDPPALRTLADRYWVGRRMILVVATSLDPARVEALATRALSSIPAGDPPPPPTAGEGVPSRIRSLLASGDPVPAEIPGLTLPDSSLFRAKKIGGRQASLTYVRPLGTVSAEDLPTLEVWNAVVSSAIQFQLREREGLAYSIGSAVDRLPDGTALWVASAGAGIKNLGRILTGFQEALAQGLATAPDSAAVSKQGAQIYGRSLMRRATRMNRAYAAGLAILNGEDPLQIDDAIRRPAMVTPGRIESVLSSLRGRRLSLVAVAY
jgi:zinc protease